MMMAYTGYISAASRSAYYVYTTNENGSNVTEIAQFTRIRGAGDVSVDNNTTICWTTHELTGPRHFYANCIGYQSRVGFSTRFYSSATR